MRKVIYILAALNFIGVSSVSAIDEGMTPQERQNRLDYMYRTAMDYYHQEKYSNAIYYWQAILNLDPTQTQPEKLIKDAREKVKALTEPVYNEVKDFYERGEYISAQEKILILLDIDAANKDYRKIYDKLQEIVETFSVLDKTDKVSMMLKKGISYYLQKPEDIRKAYLYTRYALDMEPANESTKRFLRSLEENYTSITEKEKPIKGMNFVDQSLYLALNNIYDGRYDLAISACEDVLMVEPENVLALKRLGSAYYALGDKLNANKIWQKALQLNPRDEEIKKFLKK